MTAFQSSTSPLKTTPSAIVNTNVAVTGSMAVPASRRLGLFEAPQTKNADGAHVLRSVAVVDTVDATDAFLGNESYVPSPTSTPLSVQAKGIDATASHSLMEATLRAAAPTAVGAGVGGATYLLLGSVGLAIIPVVLSLAAGVYFATTHSPEA